MSNPFKEGDRVRRIAEGLPEGVIKDCEYVVRQVIHDHIVVGGYVGLWDATKFELVSEKPKTDEELAAEYRERSAAVQKIATELQDRGYVRQWKAPHRGIQNWRDFALLGEQSDIVRFIKNETITKEI